MVKICGATRLPDIDLLAAAEVDLVGLWHGVPGGHAELDTARLATLSDAATRTGTLTPVLVTLAGRPETLAAAVDISGIRTVQLHGYQPPGLVRELKSEVPVLTVVKVLHVRHGWCPERPLIRSYERAGVDVFLFDAVGADGRIGSTAQPLDPAVVLDLAALINVPFLLAGGITAANAAAFATVATRHDFLGVDVDTGARDGAGRFDGERVRAIRREWTSGDTAGAVR